MKMQRREFLQTSAIATAAWMVGPNISLGQVPWEEELESTKLIEDPKFKITDKKALESQDFAAFPKIAMDGVGTLWAVWVALRDGEEKLLLSRMTAGAWSAEEILSAAGRGVLHPAITADSDTVAVAWVDTKVADASIMAVRVWQAGKAMAPLSFNSATGERYDAPQLLFHGKEGRRPQLVVLYEAFGKTSAIRARNIVLAGPDSIDRELGPFGATDVDCRRPSIAKLKGGAIMAWDQFRGQGSHHIYAAHLPEIESAVNNPASIKPVQVTHHPARNIAASVAVDEKTGRVWIAWMSNRRGDDCWDIPRWYYLRALEQDGDGWKLLEPLSPPTAMNLDKEGTDQSFEFPRVVCAADGKVIVAGRPSHNFCLQWYQGDQWSPLYRLPMDGWGGRGQHLETAFDAAGDLWVARRDLNANVVQKITGMRGDRVEPKLKPCDEAAYEGKSLQPWPALITARRKPGVDSPIPHPQDRWEPFEKLEGIDTPLNLYFGDIHGHTWTSDGMGDVDEYYLIRRDLYGDDFCSLTDHDDFVGRGFMPSEFEYHKAMTQHFHEDGKFVTIFGQEWTTKRPPGGAGHKCFYSTNPAIKQYNHAFKPWDDTPSIYAALKAEGAISIPHHVGWTGTDWQYADSEITPLVEICSNHGRMEFMGNRPIPHRGGIKGMFVQDALAMGHKFGIIAGADNHGLLWQHHAGWKRDAYRTGLAVILAPELTRDAIFDAMKKRRTYGTTGIKPSIDFRVNNHLMGEEITTADNTVNISVNIHSREDIGYITIVKNNQDWHQAGGDGYTMRYSVKDTAVSDGALNGVSWYYLRVEFEGPEMAWTSPVWVGKG
ncbi:hypothetical protein BH09SUM1_BH09SUM1_19560 [soil metagenome]